MKQSFLIAIVIASLAAVWVLSGVLFGSNSEEQKTTQQVTNGKQPSSDLQEQQIIEVRVRDLNAERMDDAVEVTGRTQASRKVILRAETQGQITNIMALKGNKIEQGQIVAKLDVRARGAQLQEAEQFLAQKQIQFDAAKELAERGFNSRVRLAEKRAELEQARAQVKQARIEISNIHIKAPFDGVINNQMIEKGDFVSAGTEAFEIVDLNPIEISAFLTEKQILNIKEGDKAKAVLFGEQIVEGEVTFIASAADDKTRTFAMEMTLPNDDNKIKEGLTAKIKIPSQEAEAYKISPSVLSLKDDGTVGVKIVNDDNIVEFKPIKLLNDTAEYLWVGGLPENIRLIVVGQEFVVEGQIVKPVQAEGNSLL